MRCVFLERGSNAGSKCFTILSISGALLILSFLVLLTRRVSFMGSSYFISFHSFLVII